MAQKLIEALVEEVQLKEQAKAVRAEMAGLFKGKGHHFDGQLVTVLYEREGATPQRTTDKAVVTTVHAELTGLAGLLSKALDTSLKVGVANTLAKADIVLDDAAHTVIATGVPGTALLDLDHRLNELQELFSQIPTLDPAIPWHVDTAAGEGRWKSTPVHAPKLEKQPHVIEKVKQDQYHAGQAEIVTLDKRVGTIETVHFTGRITPAKKSELLSQLELVRRAVKTALVRANGQEVPSQTPEISAKLFEVLLAPLRRP